MKCEKMMILRTVFVLFLFLVIGNSGKVKHHSGNRQALKFVKNRVKHNPFALISTGNAGLWPNVFNVATKALISVNATCGEGGREEYCRMSEKRKCDICDNFSEQSKRQRHPVHNAIDGTGDWWQSPALSYGPEYEYVTITLDLKQIYQVTHVIIKAAISPRPGSWILERSMDGVQYQPWQYYARNDKECLERYGIPATKGKPHYNTDTEVICTSYHSKFHPVENGEIHTLMQDRPGANERSPELLEFTKARYVRLRLQGLKRSTEMSLRRLTHDVSRDKKLFYSIKDINIGGLCVCNGHASSCRHNVASGHPECLCAHNSCGPNCEKCCPLYNQRKWDTGTSRDSRQCLPCNCHGHATSCHYDEDVDRAGLSMDVYGNYNGGGVCDNCTVFTTGINCEFCQRGYYRPPGIAPDAEMPCLKCNCDPSGSTGVCSVKEDVIICECRPGFEGARCNTCAPGYRGYPNCEMCPCDSRGTTNLNDCEGECTCKANAEGSFCERCKSGYFALQDRNADGCYSCFCSGVTTLCESAVLTTQTFKTQRDWFVTDISLTNTEKVTADDGDILSIGTFEISGSGSFYWLTPKEYLGNKLQAYGSDFIFKIQWYVMRGDTSGKPTVGPNMILIGSNGLIVAHGNDIFEGANVTFTISLFEDNWFHVKLNKNEIAEYGRQVTRAEFLSILTDVKYILLRAKFHTDQIEVALEEAYLTIGQGTGTVEQCSCPSGYTGLSCETCDYGYVRIYANASNPKEGFCVKCDCNNHSQTCDPDTGLCLCEHNTIGENCDRCLPGYYGNPSIGTSNDCKKCACPLEEEENNFSPSCQLDSLSISNDYNEIGYVCTQCPKGYTGDHCEICDDGYFGLPTQLGGNCQPCACGGNPCDRTTGQCLACRGNTEGWRCERCKIGYFGDPSRANCLACSCDQIGSLSENCNNITGQCECRENFVGRTCDRCTEGYGNVTAGCISCECDKSGAKSHICDQRTGLCECRPGVEGFHCDACQHLHYNFSESGCQLLFLVLLFHQNHGMGFHKIEDTKDAMWDDDDYTSNRDIDKIPENSDLDHIQDINNEDTSENLRKRRRVSNQNIDNSNSNHKRKNHHHRRKTYYFFKDNSTNTTIPITVHSKIQLVEDEFDERVLAKNRILHDKQIVLCRRTRGTRQYYSNYGPCPRWSNSYSAHNCVKNCPTYCSNPCRTSEPIYTGPGKNWYGPKYGCNCNPRGSELQTCDIKDGRCRCKPYYIGRACDKCQDGFWDSSSSGCIKCDCNKQGSDSTSCDRNNGQCVCKPGVTGQKCDSCLAGFYRFSELGCKKCEDCNNKPGHICDEKTGRCVCPPNSRGPQCDICSPNAWGYKPKLGCKECECSQAGSYKSQCESKTGQCYCKPEYTGPKCNSCYHGYYGYPKCRLCKCNADGTDVLKGNCKEGICQCNDNGMCPCKDNVTGDKCSVCKENFFGLHNKNKHGCIECFCFGRSKVCQNAPYTWGQVRTNSSRVLTLGDVTTPKPVIESDHIVGVHGNFTISDTDFNNWMNKNLPLYWPLHDIFTGDKILSYNGYLRFKATSYPPAKNNNHYPLVKIIGNDLELHYFPPHRHSSSHEVKLQEDFWKIVETRKRQSNSLVTKMNFMVVLQNIKYIFIKATDPLNEESFTNLTLGEVALDTAQLMSGNPPPKAIGVEQCQCPKEYTGESCQNPNVGYFRFRDKSTTNIIDAKVGRAEPCECNGRSTICDIETGRCLNCANHTDGEFCDKCAQGYYGNPKVDEDCQACPCPEPEKNFAVSCIPKKHINKFECICQDGYTGTKCDKCDKNYYGNPKLPDGKCVSCNCNEFGSVHGGCNHHGQCVCKEGFTGKQCNQCAKPRHIVKGTECTPCDNCTQILLNTIDNLSGWLHGNTSHLNDPIQPPWEELSKLENRYFNLRNRYQEYMRDNKRYQDLLNNGEIDKLEYKIEDIENVYDNLHSSLTNLTREAIKIQNETEAGLKDLDNIRNDLESTLTSLENFGKEHTNLIVALKEGKQHLADIKKIYDNVSEINYDDIYAKCKDLQELILKIHADDIPGKTLKLQTEFGNITDFLTAADKQLNEIEESLRATNEKNFRNDESLRKLAIRLNKETERAKKLENEISESSVMLKKASALLNETEKEMDDINVSELEDLIEQMKQRKEDLEIRIKQLDEKTKWAKKHAKNLNLKVTHIEKLLELSDKEVDAVKASDAYANIVRLLKEANATAIEANSVLNKILKEINGTNDSLRNRGYIAKADSSRLEARVFLLQNNIKEMDEILTRRENFLSKISDIIWDNGIKNGNQSVLIQSIRKQYSDFGNMRKIVQDAITKSTEMKKIYNAAANIQNFKMPYDLNKSFEECKQLGEKTKTKLTGLKTKVNEVTQKVENLLNNTLNLDAYKKENVSPDNFVATNKTLSDRLDILRRKIQKSKEIANEIRVSMSGDECRRSYHLKNLRPSVVTKLVLRFQIHEDGPTNATSIFYIENDQKDYIKVEIKEKRVTFIVKLGTEEKKEYLNTLKPINTAVLHRIRNNVELKLNNDNKTMNLKEQRLTIFDVTANNLVQIGGYDQVTTGLGKICLDDVVLNDMRIGLWDSAQMEKEQSKCEGCIRSNVKMDNGRTRFNGDGYAFLKRADAWMPKELPLQISLETFDENALLFLAINHTEPSSYLAITLKNGNIEFKINYIDARPVQITTQGKYNDGKKFDIIFRKQYDNSWDKYVLRIVKQAEEEKFEGATKTKDFLKVRKVKVFVGGIPPDYKILCTNCTENLHTHQSLLGDIGYFEFYSPVQLHEQQQYGLSWMNTPLEFDSAWFEGEGYLQLKSANIKNTFTISFVLRTSKQTGLLMDITNVVKLLIQNGRTVAELKDGRSIKNDLKVDDDAYHIIEFSNKNNQYTLRVGANESNETNGIQTQRPGDIFIGGRRSRTSDMGFDGEIRDIIIDNNLFKFNSDTVEGFEKVKIGRSRPQKKIQSESNIKSNNEMVKTKESLAENIKDMQSTEGCDKVNYNYALEPNAAKFGDTPESYVKYNLKEYFWKDEYSIEIEFRSYYKNGVLIFAQGDGKHYFLLELKDNLILLHISGKNKKTLQVLKAIDDGKWHTILIEKKVKKRKRKIILTVDGERNKPKRMPQSKILGDVYIGDVAKTAQHKVRKQLIPKINPFRGCIKPLKLNNSPQSFVNHHQIGQCFPNIERGSYFRGDAYAIYEKQFKVSSYLELNFEFRTTEQNGILLSVSSPNNSPALSLELHNGAVILSVDMGDRRVTNVTNSLSEYALCNNRWHNLTALISNELTVNVDGVSKSWVISRLGPTEEIEGTLYVGGIPDRAPEGTLKVRENFKGCIRNVKIGEKFVDWTEMEELNNVSLNSCPVT